MSPLLLAHCSGVISPDTATLPVEHPSAPTLARPLSWPPKWAGPRPLLGFWGLCAGRGGPAPVTSSPSHLRGLTAHLVMALSHSSQDSLLPSLAPLGPTSIYLLFRHHPRASSTDLALPMSPKSGIGLCTPSLHLSPLPHLPTPQHTAHEACARWGCVPGLGPPLLLLRGMWCVAEGPGPRTGSSRLRNARHLGGSGRRGSPMPGAMGGTAVLREGRQATNRGPG